MCRGTRAAGEDFCLRVKAMIDLRDLAGQLPTPIAAPVLDCWNSTTESELAQALRFLRECIFGFLQAAGVAFLRHVGASAAIEPPPLTRAWDWEDPETVVRLHGYLDLTQGGKPADWAHGLPWLDELAGMAQVRHFITGENAQRLLTLETRQALENGLRELCSVRLDFARRWLLFYLVGNAADESVVFFQGPYCLRRRLPFNLPRHVSPGLHLRVGKQVFSMEPFCWRGEPIVAGTKSETVTSDLVRPSLHVTISLRPESAAIALPEVGLIQQRNDLAGSLHSALARIEMHRAEVEETWGIILLRIRKMRDLNERLGYQAGDRVLAAMDASAGRYSHNARVLPGTLAFFPFWRRGGELLIPFRRPIEKDPAWVASHVLEVAAEIIATAQHSANATHNLHFEVGVRLEVGKFSRADSDREHFCHDMLVRAETLRFTLSNIHWGNRNGVEWQMDYTEGSPLLTRRAPSFTRVSRAAFGVIRRRTRGGRPEVFLRFNRRHGRYNFPGGHVEPEDCDLPARTLGRELGEELALSPDSYRALAMFPNPLHHIAYSAPYRADTYYVHHFYAIEELSNTLLEKITERDGRWFSAEALCSGQSPEISSEPLSALLTCYDPQTARAVIPTNFLDASRTCFGFERHALQDSPRAVRKPV